MNNKQFTDELFKRMYDIGYRKAEIKDDTLFFFVNERDCSCLFSPRVPVKSTCFEEKDQLINVGEYLGVIDWSKVAVDTPILVKDDYDEEWVKSYFASYKNGEVRAWMGGRTSFSARNKTDTFGWKYAKIAEV
nr:MAG TPA: hypothetical protein [Caudoviricetes sp.]